MWQTRSHFVYFMILSTFYNRIEFLEDFCIFCLFSSIVSLFIFQLTDTNMSCAVSAGCCYGATISLLVSVVKYWASAANRLIGEVVQSRKRPLLGPSPG